MTGTACLGVALVQSHFACGDFSRFLSAGFREESLDNLCSLFCNRYPLRWRYGRTGLNVWVERHNRKHPSDECGLSEAVVAPTKHLPRASAYGLAKADDAAAKTNRPVTKVMRMRRLVFM